ncbi:MAG: pyridoxal phosphate-dependent aminotransferase [Stygiobacter sp.]|nr:MAG: aminotransferase [Stygiobacter sp. GWC2_38_9]OGV08000.1 MAG: aminotransferase [Stygiobacter sp. RIFOXYB2_FULL_37_11]OGV12227.1 MAG: aminotransferase [Stygiobacter sp. RIFOXYA2_FULL_38_8]OGV14276.1 MAG: aminotransferase [Stygiobacter sp. RIFOXYC2_FULL_38_25]OGV82446.1 MAG: aminotransferase [Stygiobacter sp. GWF2_38_21]RJQ57471.1 MAG: pyridoxal phosphate-dependent aminotransferase [Stygiobacter sp.]
MSLSLIAKSIKASPTLALNEKAAILREKGDPVIHLGGGEPKSRAPMDALLSAVNMLNSGEVRYAPADGIPELKKSIIRYTEEYYHRKVNPENVIASSGAKQSIMVALQAILNPQEEVLFPAPYWVSYPDMAKLVGAIPVPVLPEDGTFYPRLKDIEMRVGTYTKAIIINSPNNPSGAMYSEEFISDIVDFCERKGIYLIMDDIYHRLVFDGRKPISAYDYTKKSVEESKLLIINGVSKQYAMTGFRIGWAVGNKKLIEAMSNIQGHQTSGPSVLLQKAAVGALNGIQSGVESLRVTLENNRNVLVEQLRSFEGVKVNVPDGTFYLFADFSAYEKDSQKLSQFLIDKVMVLTVPGKEFGLDGHLRISYCGTIKDITEGIERMKWALDPNSPNELYIGDRKLVRDWS